MTPTLRTRVTLAEQRALEAEASVRALSRSLKRTRADLKATRLHLGEALRDLDDARGCAAVRGDVLCRLAAHQLGLDLPLRSRAAITEALALVDRWIAEGGRRSARDRAVNETQFQLQVMRMMGRLFGGGEEDGDG